MGHQTYEKASVGRIAMGWHTVDTGRPDTHLFRETIGNIYINITATIFYSGLSAGTEYPFAQILRGTGCFGLIKDGSDWKLVWVWNNDSTASMYYGTANGGIGGQTTYHDDMIIAQLAAP